MGIVINYINAIMQKDSVVGQELIQLNEKFIRAEIEQMQEKNKKGKTREKIEQII